MKTLFIASKKQLSLLLAALVYTSFVCGQVSDIQKLEGEIDRYMAASVQHDYFSGSVMIAKSGVPLYSKGFGMASYEHNVPNTPATVFRIGSLTKQFTSLAIMQLAERGQLNVHDSICKYLPDCSEAWKSITIYHLLTQTSGIVNVSSLPEWDEKHGLQPYTTHEVVDLFRHLPLLFTPGQKHKYSNSNYHLLGLIIEKVSGQSYYDFIEQNIFKPLGMQNTGFADPQVIVPNRASGYYSMLNTFVNAPYFNIRLSYASGALQSTLNDLLLWDQSFYTTKLLTQKSIDEIFTPAKGNYGYGWVIANKFNKKTQSHSGSINGFSTYLFRFPEDELTIIVLSNSDRASATKVAHEVSALMFNKPYTIPEAQPYELLSIAYQQGGVDALLAKHRELAGNKLSDDEEELLNDIGYDLLNLKRTNEAIKVFKQNVEDHPKSANTHDSLGEAYLQNVELALAEESYKRALALDGKSESAAAALKKIEALKAQVR